MITVTDLVKEYRTKRRFIRALDGVSLTVPQGTIHGIIGHSGAGKSTLVRCLAMLDRPTSGSIVIQDQDLTKATDANLRRARRRIGLVFQHANLFDSRTVVSNVAYPLEIAGEPKASRMERARELLSLVGLADAAEVYPSQLSGGMRQRVGIARAFALSPKLLLLDEPFGMLDSLTRWELQEVLMEVWSRTKVTAVCVTHDVDEAILLADRVVMMTNGPQATIGKIVDVDLPRPRSRKALLEHPDYYLYREQVLNFLEEYEHGKAGKPEARKADGARKAA